MTQVYIGSIPFDHPHALEDIRPDEDAVLKTVGAKHASGFESLVFRLEKQTNSPVAQRRRHLVYTQSIDGSIPSRTTELGFWL